MPVLKKFNKTVEKIDAWQEECANLQYALRTLLGESGGSSIADVSVAPMPMGKIQKKKLDEADLAGNINDKDRQGKDVIVTPDGKTKKLTPQQSKEMQRNGDALTDKESEESKHQTIEYKTPVPVIIKKSIDILKTDKRLQSLVDNLFKYRASGAIGKSDEMKTLIDQFIDDRGLDPLTIYASYDLDLGDEDVDNTKDPEDVEDTEDSEDKDSETDEI